MDFRLPSFYHRSAQGVVNVNICRILEAQNVIIYIFATKIEARYIAQISGFSIILKDWAKTGVSPVVIYEMT